MERLSLLLDKFEGNIDPEVTIIWLGEESKEYAISFVNELRKNGISSKIEYDGKSMKAQMKRADKNGSNYAIIIGGDEIANGKLIIRNLEDGVQENLSREEIIKKLK